MYRSQKVRKIYKDPTISLQLENNPLLGKNGQIFEKFLFESLISMYEQIVSDGNFYTSFETKNGVLHSWELVNKDISRLMEPFDFNIQFNKALESIPAYFRNFISEEAKSAIELEYKDKLNHILSVKKKQDITNARNKILRKLKNGVIINMSTQEVPTELVEEFREGKNFIKCLEDYGKEIDILRHRFLREEVTGLLNRMYYWGSKSMINLSRKNPIKDELKLFKWDTLESDIVNCLANNFFSDEDVIFLKNVVSLLEGEIPDLNLEKFQKHFKLSKNLVLVEADKGQGIVMMNKEDLLRVYERNDLKHNFIKTDIDEDDLVSDNLERRDQLSKLIPDDVYKNLSNKLKRSLIQPTGMAPIFRPLIKVHKLDEPSYKDINIVTARMVKSSSGAPHNCIAEVASKMTEPMINDLNEKILNDFGWKPAMKDCVEVYNRLNQDDILNPSERLIGLEGDAVDMYLMLDYDIICKDIDEILNFFEKDDDFKEFYNRAIETLMKVNYWRQPGGIFTVGPGGAKGFSIGCFLAANGSELIMIWREGTMLMVLKKLGLLDYVKLLSRYKDDFLLLLKWHPTQTIEIIKILCQSFPSSLNFKFKASPIRVDFVDQSLYINQENSNYVRLLRKAESSYDYPRKTTNMKHQTIYGTIHSCVRRSFERNTLDSDIRIEEDLYRLILKSRGFSKKDYNKVKTIVLDRKSNKVKKAKWDSQGKVFSGVVTYDRKSHCHKKVSRLVQKCGLPKKYQVPLPNRGKKIWQVYFKKRVYIRDMDLFMEKYNVKK